MHFPKEREEIYISQYIFCLFFFLVVDFVLFYYNSVLLVAE